MACGSVYAEYWEYAMFFCGTGYLTGSDNGGGAAVAYLTDTGVNFTQSFRPNEGMWLWNLTEETDGQITAVTETTLTATGVTWTNGDSYRAVAITSMERSMIQLGLSITAGDIDAVLASVGACDCTVSSWGANFLSKLNIIETAIFHNCPCGSPTLSDADKALYLNWINEQMRQLRSGELDICEGATGSLYPAGAYIEHSWTDFNAAQIILNTRRRNI